MSESPASFPNIVIRASAGSGKTFQLSNRYLELLHAGTSPERILAVTFTRKAAGEIFDRIAFRLAEAASDDKNRRELAGFLNASGLTQAKCRAMLIELTQSLHRLRVGTLDGYFAKIAGGCSLELGLPPGWSVLENFARRRIENEAIAAVLAGDAVSDTLTLLNLLTKGEATRGIGSLIRDTVSDLHSLFRETEETAWKQIAAVKGLPPDKIEAGILEMERLKFTDKRFTDAAAKDLANARIGDWDTFVSQGLAAKILAGETTYYRKPIEADVVALYERMLGHAKAVLVGTTAAQTEATYRLLSKFHQQYSYLLQAEGSLGFDDVAHAIAAGASDDDRRIQFRLDGAVSHLLLDEFQDTSLVQWRVLRPTSHRITRDAASSFFCVGDIKQAIYGWRGGQAELFEAVQTSLPNIVARPLNTSYRSSPLIIDTVNKVFAGVTKHPNLERYEPAVVKWTKRFDVHSTAKSDLLGYVTLEAAPAAEEDQDADEAFFAFVASRIARAYHQAPGATIGVLTRTNAAVGRIIFHLRGLDIPASEEGGNPLVDSAAVELVLSLVQLADHPDDTAAAFHVARSPLGEALDRSRFNSSATRAGLAEELRRELMESGYGRAIYRWSQLLAPACDARDRSRLQQLVETAYAFQPEATLRPSEFLKFVEEQRTADPTAAEVRVMTIHQAKGLEFDIVVLPELDKPLAGQPPRVVISRPSPEEAVDRVCRYTNESVQSMLPKAFQAMFAAADDTRIGEALCTLYVALTRAVHSLHMLVKPIRENERNLPKTFAGLVRAALCDDSASKQGVLFAAGRDDWYAQEVKAGRLHPPQETTTSDLAPRVVLASPLAERKRGLSRQSPSGLHGSETSQFRELFALSDAKREAAMLRGTVIHAWFEQIAWLDAAPPDDAKLLAAAAGISGIHAVSIAQRQAWLAEFRALCKKGDVQRSMSLATYAKTLPPAWLKRIGAVDKFEACNERPFALVDESRMMQGRMDRVVLLRREGKVVAADVLDFKTDFVESAESVTERVEFYRPQLDAYRRTLAAQLNLPLENIESGLLFTTTGKLDRRK